MDRHDEDMRKLRTALANQADETSRAKDKAKDQKEKARKEKRKRDEAVMEKSGLQSQITIKDQLMEVLKTQIEMKDQQITKLEGKLQEVCLR